MKLRPLVASLLFACTAVLGWAQPAAPAGDNGVQDPLALQRARTAWLKSKKDHPYYTQTFDLSGLPEFKPGPALAGTIRQWGSNYLADSALAKYFEDGFRRYQPGVKFSDNLSSTFIGMASLYMKRSDVAAMGRRATWDELQAFQRVLESPPVEITMATGSLDVAGWTFALVILVNQHNPLQTISVAQLDGIFGAQRDGGWKGNEWDATAARGPDKNLRTWGQLGLTGEWADRPIHVYGYNLNYHFPRDFAEKVMGGGYKWNEQMHEFSNGAKADGSTLISAGDLLVKAVGDDPAGITYTCLRYKTPAVKLLPVSPLGGGAAVAPTLTTIQNRSYPLAREVYYYAPRPNGKPMDPLVHEFLRYVLSRQGQLDVQRDGKYLPLTAEIVREQLAKLEGVGTSAHAAAQ